MLIFSGCTYLISYFKSSFFFIKKGRACKAAVYANKYREGNMKKDFEKRVTSVRICWKGSE